jgi:RNA polymerase sigma factor (sigma-70 family)
MANKSGKMQAADREDTVQETFLQACLSVRTFNPKKATIQTHLGDAAYWASKSAFQKRLARGFNGLGRASKAADVVDRVPTVRSLSATMVGPDGSDLDVGCGDDGRESFELSEQTQAILNRLPERERICVQLRFLEGKTWDDVGQAIGRTRERSRQIVGRALLRLREWMEGEE